MFNPLKCGPKIKRQNKRHEVDCYRWHTLGHVWLRIRGRIAVANNIWQSSVFESLCHNHLENDVSYIMFLRDDIWHIHHAITTWMFVIRGTQVMAKLWVTWHDVLSNNLHLGAYIHKTRKQVLSIRFSDGKTLHVGLHTFRRDHNIVVPDKKRLHCTGLPPSPTTFETLWDSRSQRLLMCH